MAFSLIIGIDVSRWKMVPYAISTDQHAHSCKEYTQNIFDKYDRQSISPSTSQTMEAGGGGGAKHNLI